MLAVTQRGFTGTYDIEYFSAYGLAGGAVLVQFRIGDIVGRQGSVVVDVPVFEGS